MTRVRESEVEWSLMEMKWSGLGWIGVEWSRVEQSAFFIFLITHVNLG